MAAALGYPDLRKGEAKRLVSDYFAHKIGPAKRVPDPLPVAVFSGAPANDSFLKSYEWRKLRMEALKLHGASCQCCGATASTGAIIHVDHIKPRRIFPDLALSLDNLQILCHECDHGKGNWDMTDWRAKTSATP